MGPQYNIIERAFFFHSVSPCVYSERGRRPSLSCCDHEDAIREKGSGDGIITQQVMLLAGCRGSNRRAFSQFTFEGPSDDARGDEDEPGALRGLMDEALLKIRIGLEHTRDIGKQLELIKEKKAMYMFTLSLSPPVEYPFTLVICYCNS